MQSVNDFDPDGMVMFQARRRAELRADPASVATAMPDREPVFRLMNDAGMYFVGLDKPFAINPADAAVHTRAEWIVITSAAPYLAGWFRLRAR